MGLGVLSPKVRNFYMPDELKYSLEDEGKFREMLKKRAAYAENSIIQAQVVQVKNDIVIVDINTKYEGTIPIIEFSKEPKEGETVNVFLVSLDPLVLSRTKAKQHENAFDLNKCKENKTIVYGKVIEKRGLKGFIVHLIDFGLNAFLPISKADTQMRQPEFLKDMMSDPYPYYIIKCDKNSSVILSRNQPEEVFIAS